MINSTAQTIPLLRKEANDFHHFSDNEIKNSIEVLSKNLDLIDVNINPDEYCFLLRKRAQYFSLKLKFNSTLKDLQMEFDIACKNNLVKRIEEIEELIPRYEFLRFL
jgi:hypothetical protein